MRLPADRAEREALNRDLLAIRALATTYAIRVDARNGEGVAALFTTDAVFRIFSAGYSEPAAIVTGREAIATTLPGYIKPFVRTFHPMTTHVADVSGDTGSGNTYCYSTHFLVEQDLGDGTANGTDVFVLSRYVDTYRRVDGEWLMATRDVRFQWSLFRQARITF